MAFPGGAAPAAAVDAGVHPFASPAPPSWYCPGGSSAQVNGSSQRLDACATVIATAPYYDVLFYANQTGGGNTSAPYAFVFQYGDGASFNQSSWWNATGSETHYYGSSGTFDFVASVSDPLGSLNVTIPLSVNFTVSLMAVSLSSFESTTNGVTSTDFSCSITGGYPFFNFQYAFGDGSYQLDNTSTSTGGCGAAHTYGSVPSITTYTVDVRAWDPSGANASASLNVTPSYNVNASGSGGNATAGSHVTLLSSSVSGSLWNVTVWVPGVSLNSTASLTVGATSAVLVFNTTARSNGTSFSEWGACSGSAWWSSAGSAGVSTGTTSCSFLTSGPQYIALGLANSAYNVSGHFSFFLAFNGSGNTSGVGSSVTQVTNTSTVDAWLIGAWAPGLNLSANATLRMNGSAATITLGGIATGASAFQVFGNWGDGSWWAINESGGGGYSFAELHAYSGMGTYDVRVGLVSGGTASMASFSFSLPASAAGTGGSGNGSYGATISLVTNSSAQLGWHIVEWVPNVNASIWVSVVDVNTSLTLTENGTISAAEPNYVVFGGVSHSSSPSWNWSVSGSSNGTYFLSETDWITATGFYFGYVELMPNATSWNGSYTNFTFNFSAAGLTQGGGAGGSGGSSSGGSGAYPTSVSVTVGAAPVTGGAPLTVTLSAFIDGGSAPFVVEWSLPGSSNGTNGTGLMITTTYNLSGWYPATAFVYNTTSSYGSVLVGYGSVWLYVTGNVTGGGSGGNGSGNHSGKTPIPGATATGGAPPPAMSLTAALLVAVATGAVAGGIAGFAVGRGPVRRGAAPPDPPVATESK